MATILGNMFDIAVDSSAEITAIFVWSADIAADGSVSFTCNFGAPSTAATPVQPTPASTAAVGWGTTGSIPIGPVSTTGKRGEVLTIDGDVTVTWGVDPGSIFVASYTPRVRVVPFLETPPIPVVQMVPTPGTFLGPVTPNLARVIAQAADSGIVTFPKFYVVCRWLNENQGVPSSDISLDPYNVQQPVERYDVALCMVEKLKSLDADYPYGIFGPFQNTGSGAGIPPATQRRVQTISGTAENDLAATTDFSFEGTQYDAMFWSLEVVQKMVVPYYAEEYGPEFAANVMREFTQAPVAVVMHLPWSEYTEMSVTGGPSSVGPQADPTQCGGQSVSSSAAPTAARRTRYRPGIPFLREDGTLGVRVLHPRT
jgi:hypothetical protein